MSSTSAKLELEGIKQHFQTNTDVLSRLLGDQQVVKAVDGVTLRIREGESFGLAGESGCGKTTLGKTAIRLLDPTDGRITFDGRDITEVTGSELNEFRSEAQIIHQDPYKSLNPRFRVFKWVEEPLKVHGIGNKEERRERVYETLEMAGLRPPEQFLDEYPSDLSGGERQRVGIARALALEPSFLVADEPASMLDVSIRASILETFERLQDQLGLTALYVSHDLSLLKHMCDRIGIMYLGELVEVGPANQIINDPQHPYTQALVSSVPVIDPDVDRDRVKLVGEVPDPINAPSGCRFHPRCPKIVPPDEYEFEQKNWRAVANLRRAILQDEVETVTAENGLREEFGVPDHLSDQRAEAVVSEAIEAVARNDLQEAKDLLGEEFTTPCEEPPIETYRVGEEQRAKCVLHGLDDKQPIDGGRRDETALSK
ncbi:MAG: ABC transporter ATP-binding protein [Halalkalicoccus sp.]